MDSLIELGKAMLAESPYVLFVGISFLVSYLMFKTGINALHKQSEKTIEEMRKAYDSALKKLINFNK